MAKRYVKLSLPIEAYKNFKTKQIRMNETRKELGYKSGLPLTRVITAISNKPVWFEHDEIIQKKKRKHNGGIYLW